MASNYNLKELIPELLKIKGNLTKKEIRKSIIKNNNDINQISDKALNENLLKLLRDSVIEISGYKFIEDEKRRLQNIKSECLTFDVVRISPIELRTYFKNLDNEDEEVVKKAEKNLKAVFRKKYFEMINKERNKWENLKNLIICRELTDEELLFYDTRKKLDIPKLENDLKEERNLKKKIIHELEVDIKKQRSEKFEKRLKDLRRDYINARIFYLEKIPDELPLIDWSDGPHEAFYPSFYETYIDLEGTMTKKSFLKRHGYSYPKTKTQNEIYNLLHEILSEIDEKKEFALKVEAGVYTADDFFEQCSYFPEKKDWESMRFGGNEQEKQFILSLSDLESIDKFTEFIDVFEKNKIDVELTQELYGKKEKSYFAHIYNYTENEIKNEAYLKSPIIHPSLRKKNY